MDRKRMEVFGNYGSQGSRLKRRINAFILLELHRKDRLVRLKNKKGRLVRLLKNFEQKDRGNISIILL